MLVQNLIVCVPVESGSVTRIVAASPTGIGNGGVTVYVTAFPSTVTELIVSISCVPSFLIVTVLPLTSLIAKEVAVRCVKTPVTKLYASPAKAIVIINIRRTAITVDIPLVFII